MKGKRLSTNMISSITNQGKVEFMIYSGTMNADRFLKFLRQLIGNRERKIYLILDNPQICIRKALMSIRLTCSHKVISAFMTATGMHICPKD